jgi:hypothetical protein
LDDPIHDAEGRSVVEVNDGRILEIFDAHIIHDALNYGRLVNSENGFQFKGRSSPGKKTAPVPRFYLQSRRHLAEPMAELSRLRLSVSLFAMTGMQTNPERHPT